VAAVLTAMEMRASGRHDTLDGRALPGQPGLKIGSTSYAWAFG
jgi:hypothetical protein